MADGSDTVHPNPFHTEVFRELKQMYEQIHPSYRIPLAVVCVLIVFTAIFRILFGSPLVYFFGEEDVYDAKQFKRGTRYSQSLHFVKIFNLILNTSNLI